MGVIAEIALSGGGGGIGKVVAADEVKWRV